MKSEVQRKIAIILLIEITVFSFLFSQGAADPLSIYGLEQKSIVDIRSRGMGGTNIASGSTSSILFVNPAGLSHLNSIELRIGGTNISTFQQQTQGWVPNRLYTGLSIMMEDKWGGIKQPMVNDSTPVTDPWEQLQKPFDNIGPNWSRNTNQTLPLSAALAVPISVDEFKFVFGIGGSQAIDLTHYFQNNNVTDPLLGNYRPQPIAELQPGDTLRARWFQYTRKRDGTIWGITPAVSVSYSGISAGVSATYYTGSSDDIEQRLDRGFLTFIYNRFKVQDTVKYASIRSGTSTYSGLGITLGVKIEQPVYALAAVVELPYTMERKYSRSFHSREDILIVRATDSVKTTIVNTTESGTEKIQYPTAYSIGLLLTPFSKWSFAFDYEARNLNQVEYTLANGSTSKPWVGESTFKIGAEYAWQEWLMFRGGYREEPQVFSPAGSAIIGSPAVMSVYSFGTGLVVLGVEIDAAYEYAYLRYSDSWQSNVNQNTTRQHRLLVGLGYKF